MTQVPADRHESMASMDYLHVGRIPKSARAQSCRAVLHAVPGTFSVSRSRTERPRLQRDRPPALCLRPNGGSDRSVHRRPRPCRAHNAEQIPPAEPVGQRIKTRKSRVVKYRTRAWPVLAGAADWLTSRRATANDPRGEIHKAMGIAEREARRTTQASST